MSRRIMIVPHVEVQVKFDDLGSPGIDPTAHGMYEMEEDSGDWEGPPPRKDPWFWLLILALGAVAIIIILAILATGAHPG